MSEKHTQGRLIVKGTWLIPESHAGRMIGASTDKARDQSEYAHAVASVEGKYQNDGANARRLAACWNACEGLTQDHFDGGWTALGLSKSAKRAEDQLAAASALLTEILESDDCSIEALRALGEEVPSDICELTDRIRAFLKGQP